MTELAILAALTNFILPTSFLSYMTQMLGEVSLLSYMHKEDSKLQFFFTFGALSNRQNITGPEDPPNSYRR